VNGCPTCYGGWHCPHHTRPGHKLPQRRFTGPVRLAIDVGIAHRATRALLDHDISIQYAAIHAEPDAVWFKAAVEAGIDAVVSPDADLEVLCYDARIPHMRIPLWQNLRWKDQALWIMDKLAEWRWL
jgi:hypothetical protein